MAKIQLVIEIEERLYKNIIDNDKDDEEFEAMDMAFCNAKPLPKGHGRLIECERLQEVFRRNVVGYAGFKQLFDNAPTIIEAEGGGEDADSN